MHELIIEAGRTEKHYWRDLWRYRELFYILACNFFLVQIHAAADDFTQNRYLRPSWVMSCVPSGQRYGCSTVVLVGAAYVLYCSPSALNRIVG